MSDLKAKIEEEVDRLYGEEFDRVRQAMAMRAEAAIQTWKNEQVEKILRQRSEAG